MEIDTDKENYLFCFVLFLRKLFKSALGISFWGREGKERGLVKEKFYCNTGPKKAFTHLLRNSGAGMGF